MQEEQEESAHSSGLDFTEDYQEEEKRHKAKKEWMEKEFKLATEAVIQEIKDLEAKREDLIKKHAVRMEELNGALVATTFPGVANIIGTSAAQAVVATVESKVATANEEDI